LFIDCPSKGPRQPRKVNRNLIDLLKFSHYSRNFKGEGREAIENFDNQKLDWLRKYLAFAGGRSTDGKLL